MFRALSIIAAVAALAVSAAPASAGTSKKPPQLKHYDQSSTASGIIMRDGGICNPRWGC